MDDLAHSSVGRLQFITFKSGDQEFGADIMAIREIRGWTKTTPLPHSPEYVCGVINLRGVILPVIDLQARLGFGKTEAAAKHAIIVVESVGRTMGLLVDAVSDIVTTSLDAIQKTPELAVEAKSEFVAGIAVLDQRMITILDMKRLSASLVGHDVDGSQAA